jgi:hypothetical protein
MKKLKKKILQLEARIQKDTKKLAKLKAKLKPAIKSKSKQVVPVKAAKTPSPAKKRTLTPEGRAKLSALMKARWDAKKAAPVPNPNTSA